MQNIDSVSRSSVAQFTLRIIQALYCPETLFTFSTHQTLYSALGRSKPGTHVSVTEFSVLVADRL